MDTVALNNTILWLRTHQQKLRLGFMVFLGLFCLAFIALLVRVFLLQGPVVGAEISLSRDAANNPRWTWYRPPAAPKQEQVATDDGELKPLKIKGELLGVVVAGEKSVATISEGRNKTSVFKLGDEIERNVSLEEVELHRIIVTKNGRRGEILLKTAEKPDKDQELIKVTKKSQPTASAGSGFTIPGIGQTLPVNIPGEGTGIRLVGVSTDVSDIADLSDGDVIMNINGTPAGEMLSNPFGFQQLLTETSLPMTILRDGETQEIHVNAASLFERILPQLDAGLIQ